MNVAPVIHLPIVRRCHFPSESLSGRCRGGECRQYMDRDPAHYCALLEVERHRTRTVRQISPMLGISFDRVNQIEHAALKKIQRAFREWQGHVVAEAISGLASLFASDVPSSKGERGEKRYHPPCAGWARDWALDPDRVRRTYLRKSQSTRREEPRT